VFQGTVDSRSLEPSREIENSSSYREFEEIITENKEISNGRNGWGGHASQSHIHFTCTAERDED